MSKFKVGDSVHGEVTFYTNSHVTYNQKYYGIITGDYADDSYEVDTEDFGRILVELYNDESMEHTTKLHKLLAGDENV
jgi:hypothetical protein